MMRARIENIANFLGYSSSASFAFHKGITLFSSAALIKTCYSLLRKNDSNSSSLLDAFALTAAMITLITKRDNNYSAEPVTKLMLNSIQHNKTNPQYFLFSSATNVKKHHDDLAFWSMMTTMLFFIEYEMLRHRQTFSYLDMIIIGLMAVSFTYMLKSLIRDSESMLALTRVNNQPN